MVRLTGYQITEQIYAGTRTLVYRGIREKDQQRVVIKLMRNEYPSFEELVQFRNQYTIAKNLDLPGVIHPLSLETYGNGYALVMVDVGGISLKEWLLRFGVLDIKDFLSIALEIVTILHRLYQNRVIHKDIKPANILIHPETKEVTLIDFSISSLLPRETKQIQSPNILEGTLAYISPEQTGRMNRGIDYRSDFYSLGVTFFELLSGILPFTSDDPMELVHCHIARLAPSMKAVTGKDFPAAIEDIVMKLMAKNAEHRYQTALGLKHDLETCLHQYHQGNIAPFKLGTRDISDRFIISEKLYGREQEVQTLLAAFDRIARLNSQSEMMLVAGFSGIGKTAVVNEIHKPIVRDKGYFIKGKFDQLQRNIPLSAIIQAFRDLMRQLLSESDASLQHWKILILSALGDNAQVIIDVIPELETIIDKQPSVTELSGSAAQNRFNLLFAKFIQVFTAKEHPLVIFLDDLQWADSASLSLMQLLMNDHNISYLLLIGAYRDNEVNSSHPFILTLEEIKKTGATVNSITLTPLSSSDLNHLVTDSLNCAPEIAQSLTETVYQKTKGNPFFSNQFLKALSEDKIITFDFEKGYWQYEASRLNTLKLTDDVVEFMALQLQKLPFASREVLKLAACIGNTFDLETLAIVYEKSQFKTATDLWKPLQEGLILPTNEVYKLYQEDGNQVKNSCAVSPNYKFFHDRVQQAAYFLIPDEQKQQTHLQIGRLLLRNTSQESREENVFNIVNQLNLGLELINRQEERNELAYLNLTAGRKAKAATAYKAALEYLQFGLKLLTANCWFEQYDMALALHEEAVEAAYLSGDFSHMNKLVEVVLHLANNQLDKVKTYEVQIQAFMAQSQVASAMQTALQGLEGLGITFPQNPGFTDIQSALSQTTSNLNSRPIEDLINLPLMTDPVKLAAMRLLSSAISPAYVAAPYLLPLIIATQVNLSIIFGNAAGSPFAYVNYSLVLCGIIFDIDSGYKFGQLAVKTLEKVDARQFEARTIMTAAGCAQVWKNHIRESIRLLQTSYHIGLETGDLEFAGYGASLWCYYSYLSGENLTALARDLIPFVEGLSQLQQLASVNYLQIYHQAILHLTAENYPDLEQNEYLLVGKVFNESEKLPLLQKNNDRFALFHIYFNKLILCYLFENFAQAWINVPLTESYLDGVVAQYNVLCFYFYSSLTQLSMYQDLDEDSQKQALVQVKANQDSMQLWLHHGAMNCQHKYYLVEAEKYRVLNHKLKAMDYYDKAIASAKENIYIQEEALANELAAKFYLGWNKNKVAQTYLIEAYYCYTHWGAKAKVMHLENRYGELLAPIVQREKKYPNSEQIIYNYINTDSITHSNKTATEKLDLATVVKASQTLSSEFYLDKLLAKVMQVMMENAGAQKSALILLDDGNLVIKAIANIDTPISTIVESIPIPQSTQIPLSIVNYVFRTQETVLIDDVSNQNDFATDTYLRQYRVMSLLCTPIINQGKLIGIVYLENNLSTGAFTKNRLKILNLLCSQAAISIDNATLYNTLEQKVSDRTQQLSQALEDLKATQKKLVESEKMAALGSLVAGVAHEINTPIGTSITAASTLADETQSFSTAVSEGHLKRSLLNNYLQVASQSTCLILNNLNRAGELVHSFKQVAVDQVNLEQRTFNLIQYIEEVLVSLAPKLKQATHTLTVQGDENITINSYPGAIAQIVTNLVMNSLIHAYQPGETGLLYFAITSQQNTVQIEYGDDGCGICADHLKRIFEPFFTTARNQGGTGLGMHIVYNLVTQKLQGKIVVRSEVNVGTIFVIELPYCVRN